MGNVDGEYQKKFHAVVKDQSLNPAWGLNLKSMPLVIVMNKIPGNSHFQPPQKASFSSLKRKISC